MIYCETYKFKNEALNLSNFGFSFKSNPNAINVIYSKNLEVTTNFYESFWNADLYTGSFFVDQMNLKNLTLDQRKDWFYKYVGFIDKRKFINNSQTVISLMSNTFELLNKKRNDANKYLKHFSLDKYRNQKLKHLNLNVLIMLQLCLCISVQKKYLVIRQDLFDTILNNKQEWFISALKDVLKQYSVTFLCLSSDLKSLSLTENNTNIFLINLDQKNLWKSNDSLTIYSQKFKETGFKLNPKTFNGLAYFLWKNISSYWVPLIFISLIFYAGGMFLLVFYSSHKLVVVNIFGYLLISLVAVMIAITTIISFFKLEKKMDYLRLLNIKERYIGMILPTNVFIVSISICLLSYIFNLFLFLGLYKTLVSQDWINTLYISTAFIIWCLVITVLVIISYEKSNNILKLIKSIK